MPRNKKNLVSNVGKRLKCGEREFKNRFPMLNILFISFDTSSNRENVLNSSVSTNKISVTHSDLIQILIQFSSQKKGINIVFERRPFFNKLNYNKLDC